MGIGASDPSDLDTAFGESLVPVIAVDNTMQHAARFSPAWVSAMHDILQDFPIAAPPERVFDAVSSPAGLNEWWTQSSNGRPEVGGAYELDFGPSYQWRAEVTKAVPGAAFELRMTTSDDDWRGTLVGFELRPNAGGTQVRFYHRGWPVSNDHYRTSNHCWAMYLRILRRHLENGESVPYEQRLSV